MAKSTMWKREYGAWVGRSDCPQCGRMAKVELRKEHARCEAVCRCGIMLVAGWRDNSPCSCWCQTTCAEHPSKHPPPCYPGGVDLIKDEPEGR